MNNTPSSLRAASALGLTTSLFLSGVYFASSQLVIHNLYPLPTTTSTKIFTDLYYGGAAVVVPLAFTSAAAWATAAYLAGPGSAGSVGGGSGDRRMWFGLAMVGVLGTMGYTRLAMMGVIERLLELGEGGALGVGREEVVELLGRWKGMNFVRSALAFGGGMAGLWGTLAL